MTRKIQNQLRTFGIRTPDALTIRMGVSGGIAIYPKHAETAPRACYALPARAFIKAFKNLPPGTGVIREEPDNSGL